MKKYNVTKKLIVKTCAIRVFEQNVTINAQSKKAAREIAENVDDNFVFVGEKISGGETETHIIVN